MRQQVGKMSASAALVAVALMSASALRAQDGALNDGDKARGMKSAEDAKQEAGYGGRGESDARRAAENARRAADDARRAAEDAVRQAKEMKINVVVPPGLPMVDNGMSGKIRKAAEELRD